jgi:Tfp pilus assembly protein PilF
MLHRVAVIGSLVVAGLASFASAQFDTARVQATDTMPKPGASSTERVPASLSGTVNSIDNRPVSNARVEIRDMSGSIVAATYTGPNGSFEVTNLASGRYEVTATEGLSDTRQTLYAERGANTVTLHLSESNAVSNAGDSASVSVADMRVPDKARKALSKARELFAKKRTDDARKEIAKALEIYPRYAAALCERGIMNLVAGRFSDARSDFEESLKSDPNGGMAYIGFAAASNSEAKFDDAVRALDRGVALMPTAWQAYFEMARAYLGKGDFATALRNIDKAQQFMASDYPPLHLVRAHALLGVKSYTEAVAELEAYLRVDPSAPDAEQTRKQLDAVRAFAAAGGGK